MAANGLSLSAQVLPGFAGSKVISLVKVDLTGVSNKQVIANCKPEVRPAGMEGTVGVTVTRP